MATATRRLVIDPNAKVPISVDDPLQNLLDDAVQGRARITSGAVDFPTLAERRQGLIEGSTIGKVKPSLSRTPNISPFPLGCPSGFYQQGDVCIPSVDLIPGEDKFPRPAGHEFPRGVIQDVIPPDHTNQGEFFYVQCIIENDGGVEGKFFFRVTIESLNVDTETEPIRVPGFEKALLYKRVRMPDHAGSLDDIEAEVTISHLNEEEDHITDETKIVDDTTSTIIPGPERAYEDYDTGDGNDYGYGGGSGSTPECFTMTLSRLFDVAQTYDGVRFNNIDALSQEIIGRGQSLNNTAVTFCPTGANNDLAVIINGTPFVPTDLAEENDTRNAAITLTPRTAVRDGEPITVVGMNFAPHETIDIELRMTTSAVDDLDDEAVQDYEGQVFTESVSVNADSGGDFRTTVRSRSLPSGIRGDAVVTATGVRSSKLASKPIQIT